jgi:iron only hydrogenase large subunit-like protein
MSTFDDLYYKTLKNAVSDGRVRVEDEPGAPRMIECLTKPEEYPLIWRTRPCVCPPDAERPCAAACSWSAMSQDEDGNVTVDNSKCMGCEACIDACKLETLTASKDIIPVVKELLEYNGPIFALVAPAFSGQLGEAYTFGRLRTALKKLGFSGVLEVAAFADILTMKEALEFDKNIQEETDIQLTSCCCPMWIGMIKKLYHQLLPNVPGTVSPMIAGGRTVKVLYPEAKTVFIGPCLAKKAERREPDISDAIDYVLTFEELRDLLSVTNLQVEELEEDIAEHSSASGIGYAVGGGVSEAVSQAVSVLNPNRRISIKTRRADGVSDCKAMIDSILAGDRSANFFEGMGCKGGCVGGPRAVLPKEEGAKHVLEYKEKAKFDTPMENPYVIALLERLGYETVEEFLEKSTLYDRKLD